MLLLQVHSEHLLSHIFRRATLNWGVIFINFRTNEGYMVEMIMQYGRPTSASKSGIIGLTLIKMLILLRRLFGCAMQDYRHDLLSWWLFTLLCGLKYAFAKKRNRLSDSGFLFTLFWNEINAVIIIRMSLNAFN